MLAHWEACERQFLGAHELDPNWDLYEVMDANGSYHLFTARVDGVVVGYAGFFLKRHIHYDLIQAAQDIIYFTPSARGFDSYRFISYCDEQLAKLGAESVYHFVKADPKLDFSPLLRRLGYKHYEQVFHRPLKTGV